MAAPSTNKRRKIKKGTNPYIDRFLELYPDDDHDIWKIGDDIVIKPKEANTE